METDPTIAASRRCPYCAETMRRAAKVCPHCRQWISWMSLRSPAVSAFVGLTGMLGFFGILTVKVTKAFGQMWNPPPYYAESQGALEVTESRMNWVQTKDGLRIFVTGLLTNHSAAAWQSLEFECRFFDTHGVMIDAANARGLLTVAANGDSAFRLSVVPGSASNLYASFTTAVSTARSSRAPF